MDQGPETDTSPIRDLKNIAKTLKWWKNQLDQAVKTIQWVFVAMGIDATKSNLALPTRRCWRWLSLLLRSNHVQQKAVRSILPIAHPIILYLALITGETLSPSVAVFQLCHILQTTLMVQYVLLAPNHNSKLHALLGGTFCHRLFTFVTTDQFIEMSHSFFACESVYVRFSHLANFQPKFHIGSTLSFILDREHSRYRKFLQVRQNK